MLLSIRRFRRRSISISSLSLLIILRVSKESILSSIKLVEGFKSTVEIPTLLVIVARIDLKTSLLDMDTNDTIVS